MKYTIIIPSVGGKKLDVCLDSIDSEILKNVIIYRNAPNIKVRHNVKEVAGSGVNDGVAAGWNYGVKHVIDNNLDYLIILSQNVVFTSGMRDFIEFLDKNRPRYGLKTQESWHLIALSKEILNLAGEFDTNFYPIYYEDTDYSLRLHLLGIIGDFSTTTAKCLPTPSGYSTTLGLRPAIEHCQKYFIKKWGDIFNYMDYEIQDFYPTPFNDSNNSIGYFEKKTTEQLMLECGYENRKQDLYIEEKRND